MQVLDILLYVLSFVKRFINISLTESVCNKLKNIKISHCRNNSIIHSENFRNRSNIDTPNTHKDDRLLSWIATELKKQ